MFDYLFTGVILGITAGISPGPLLILVITETIKYNKRQGIKISLVPLISDFPIVLLSIFIIFKLTNSDLVLAVISILGALFLIFLGWENIKIKTNDLVVKKNEGASLKKAVIANFLSPHPYLFWILVGAPITIKAYNQSFISAVFFVLGFYVCIIGTKIVVALISDKSKSFLKSRSYLIIVKILGFVLLLLSIILIKDAYEFFV